MKCRIAILILVSQLILLQPPQEVDECNLRALVARPVQGCRSPVIFGAEIKPSLVEEEQADGLVALGGDVHHVQTVLILHFDVRSIVDEGLAYLDVASEGSVVDGSELVLVGLKVHPLGHFLAFKLLLGILHDNVIALLPVMEDRLVE